jgi:uncharacterized repeat protein (TIGR02543 family)
MMKSSVTNRKQRFWALLLAVVMVVGLLPVANIKAANNFEMDDNDVSDFVVGAIIEAGDTVTNKNNGSPSSNAVKIFYQDVDGSDLTTCTIAVSASDTVPKYSDTLKTGVGALSTDHQSDKWLITSANKYDVGTAVGGCGDVSRVYVSAVPRYTIDWDPNTTETYSPLVTTDAFKVTFDRTATASPINTSDATYKLTRTGYTFNGWKLADDTLNPVIKSDNVTTYDTLDGTTAAGPGLADYVIKLRADWTKNPTIECIYNCPLVSKKSFIYDTQTIVPGTAPVQPADPVEPGFTFGGWYADADCTKVFDFTITRTNDAKAYAKWTRNTNYTLTFNNNIPAGEVASKDTPDITGIEYYTTSGTYYTVTLPGAPVKSDGSSYEHYTFDGWSVNVTPTPSPAPNMYNGSVTMDKLITDLGADKSPIPMIANWTGKNYTIKMDYDAPAAVSPVPANPVDQTKPYGTGATSAISIAATMNPGVTSYAFVGWSLTKGAATADYTADTDVKTLVDAAETAGVKFGSTSATADLKDTLTLYGVWNPIWTVTYYGNGDDANSVIPGYVENGDTFTLSKNTSDQIPYFVKIGYHMTGWNSKADGSGAAYALGASAGTILKDVDYYAQWKQNTYTVAFDANTTDTVTGTMTPQGFAYGDPAVALSKNQFVRTGYTFTGWATTPTGAVTYTDGQSVKDLTNVDNGTITLYAVWQKNTYTITWKDYNGTVLKTDAGVTVGTIPAYTGTPTKASDATNTYTFSGWNDGAASYAVGTALPALVADTTYTAYYSASVRNYTITWKDGDGNTLGTTTVAYGTVPTYTINKTPTKSADATYTYSFNNTWSPAIVAVTGNATYTAQFAGTAKSTGTSPAPTGTSPAPTGTSPTPAIVTPTATPTPAVVTPTATPTPDPNGDGGNGGQGTPVEEKIYDIKYFEVDDDGNEIELKNTGNPKTYKYGEGAVIDKKLDREGYVFLGWFTKDGTKPVTKISKKAKGTKKLYARYEAVPEDDGTGDGNDNINGNPSDFSTLFVRLTNYTENSMTLTWEAMEYIDGYDIFGSRCNSKDVIRPYEPIASVGADKTEYVMSDLLAKTYYKFYIRAYILVNNEKRYITTSINVHGVTLNDTYGVADEINIDKVVTKSGKKSRTKYNRAKDGDVEEINITMKVGQTLTIVTSEYNADGKEIRAHRPISFESSNPNICKVGKKNSHKYGVAVAGKANTYKSRTITAKAAGECTIWVFAQNGIYTKVNVKVKPAD